MAFADSVAAWGTYRNLPEGHDFTTAELKANVFAAGHPGDVLHAFGRPLHLGRRTRSGRCESAATTTNATRRSSPAPRW